MHLHAQNAMILISILTPAERHGILVLMEQLNTVLEEGARLMGGRGS
jgi:hypothetical protein